MVTISNLLDLIYWENLQKFILLTDQMQDIKPEFCQIVKQDADNGEIIDVKEMQEQLIISKGK